MMRREDIAPEVVRAQQMLRGRLAARGGEVGGQRVVRREHRRKDADAEDDESA